MQILLSRAPSQSSNAPSSYFLEGGWGSCYCTCCTILSSGGSKRLDTQFVFSLSVPLPLSPSVGPPVRKPALCSPLPPQTLLPRSPLVLLLHISEQDCKPLRLNPLVLTVIEGRAAWHAVRSPPGPSPCPLVP